MSDDLHPDVLAWGFTRDAAAPDWLVRPAATPEHFSALFGELRLRVDGEGHARMRVVPAPHHLNIHGSVHGGLLLAAIDQAAFVCGSALGIDRVRGGVTVDLSTQFLAPPAGTCPFDVTVEVLRVTGRLAFVRGLIEQAGTRCAAYAMTIRRA